MSQHQGLLGLVDEDETEEQWRPIDGWPGYEVSDWGRVRSYRSRGYGKGRIKDVPEIVASRQNSNGYTRVDLYNGDGRPRRKYVHSLVLAAFVGPRPRGTQVCHDPDPDRTNNRLKNLRWDTQTENNIDRLRRGQPKTAKISEEIAREIGVRLVGGEPPGSIARRYRISIGIVRDIREGATWGHVTNRIPYWGKRPREYAKG